MRVTQIRQFRPHSGASLWSLAAIHPFTKLRCYNRVENSHLSFRRRERAMLRFRRMRTLQKFASVHNHFALERHLVDKNTYKERRSAALAEWQLLAA